MNEMKSLTLNGKLYDSFQDQAARKQIEDLKQTGTGGNVTVEPAEDDIPRVFFGGALQQTKTDAVVPFRYISKTEDISGYAKIKAQGNSSMSYPKKNQTVKMYKDAACTEKLKVNFKNWGKQEKYCYKANWVDITHSRNIVSARLWGDVVKSRANYAELPELYRTSPNQGAVDGFPVKVYAAGVYQGRYTINIPKDKWMSNMDDDLDTHCILCGEGYVSGCFREASVAQWTDEIHDTMPNTIKTRWLEVIDFVMNSTDEDFKSNLSNYFDVPSLIDYHLFGLVSCGLDAYGKNQLYFTYDGQKWIAGMYDMDWTWGLHSLEIHDADYPRTSYEDYKNGGGNLLYVRLEKLFYESMQERWAELKASALSIENIVNRFERFTDITPNDLVVEDYADTTVNGNFSAIPCQGTNNIQQIRAFALARLNWTDEYVAALSDEYAQPCTAVALSADALTFTNTDTQTLTATVEPTLTSDAIVWTTSNNDVATVENGVVTPVGNGECIITVICGSCSDTCSVVVSAFEEVNILSDLEWTDGLINSSGVISNNNATDMYSSAFDVSKYAGSYMNFTISGEISSSRYCYFDEDGSTPISDYTMMNTGTDLLAPKTAKTARINVYPKHTAMEITAIWCQEKYSVDNLQDGRYLPTGEWVESSNDKFVELAVSAGQAFKVKGFHTVCYYSADGTFLSCIEYNLLNKPYDITIPENAANMKLTMTLQNAETASVSKKQIVGTHTYTAE